MIGEIVRSRRAVPVLPLILVALATTVYFGTVGSRDAAAIGGATIPILLATAAGLGARRRVEARFLDDSIDVQRPHRRRIEFSQVIAMQILPRALRASRRVARPAGLILYDANGCWVIPRKLTHRLADVIEFIASRIGFGGSRQIDARLMQYLQAQERTFGVDRVYCLVGRTMPAPRYGASLMLFGVVIIAAALLLPLAATPGGNSADNYAALCAFVPIGVLAILFGVARMPGVPKKLRSSSLVISPVGLALIQGEVVGQLEWAEMNDLRRGSVAYTRRSFEFSRASQGLMLRVEGADIGIADIYDRPTAMIERLIRLYWRGIAMCDACGAALTPATGPACPACRLRLGTL